MRRRGCVVGPYRDTVAVVYRYVYPVVVLWVGFELVRAVRSPLLQQAWRIAAGVRIRHLVANLPVQVATLCGAAVLLRLPGGQFGWWNALGGQGSILMASSATPSAAQRAMSLILLGLFAVAAPVLAMGEERLFRAGSERRTRLRRVAVAAGFGLAHLTMGIPVAVAVALTVPGLWFTGRYLAGYRTAQTLRGDNAREAAIAHATCYHVAWNWSLAAVAVVAIATGS